MVAIEHVNIQNHSSDGDTPPKLLNKTMKVAIIAGEDSGDKLGAGLIIELKKHRVNWQFEGIGGEEMIKAGLTSLYPMEKLSVMGIGAILKRLPELLKIKKELIQRWCSHQRPDIVIGIDAPEFNTGLELSLKKVGIRTIHYVSPSIWAWRPRRIKKIKRAVDHMLTLFPFENAIYEQHNMAVTCVGHPMAYEINEQIDKESIRKSLNIAIEAKVIALLPGSRKSELKYLAPLFLEVAERLHNKYPSLKFISAAANKDCQSILNGLLKQYPNLEIEIGLCHSREVMSAADVLLISSGTATLEGALINRPMVVSYQVSELSYQIFSKLSVLRYYALPNLLAQKEIVPEFLQHQATVENIVSAIEDLIFSQNKVDLITHQFSDLHKRLKLGGNKLAAEVVLNELEGLTC